MVFGHDVERWRAYARQWAQWAAGRYGVALDEHDVLALIEHESAGNPRAVSPTGCSGLGQFAAATLHDYNAENPGHELKWADMTDPAKASGQIRAIAWLLGRSRQVVGTWSPPDAKSHADLWALARYGWGGGHLTAAIADYKVAHGRSPTFDELAAELPHAGEPHVRPWSFARTVHARAAADRGEAPEPVPFRLPTLQWEPVILLFVVAALAVFAAIVLSQKDRPCRATAQ